MLSTFALQPAVVPLAYKVLPHLRWLKTAGKPSGSVVEVKSDADFSSVIAKQDKQELAIVDFTAKWCGPCKFIAPHYEELSKKHPEIKFMKVDIDAPDIQKTVMDHNITGVPTFYLYKGTQRVESFSGARLEYLKEIIAKHSK